MSEFWDYGNVILLHLFGGNHIAPCSRQFRRRLRPFSHAWVLLTEFRFGTRLAVNYALERASGTLHARTGNW